MTLLFLLRDLSMMFVFRSSFVLLAALLLMQSTASAASPAAAVVDPSRLGTVRIPEGDGSVAPVPPVRAYAIDGRSFFYGGQQYILDTPVVTDDRGELARQRLQEMLDGGELSVQPLGEKIEDSERAQVRINGELLTAPPVN
ncbi:hypothetical protein [Denitromonas halophila]|uniref:Uncharacterized protein n=1 Tax=Denitromonas halophila TaxID=1629404 RepID=A0A557QKA8_9RHOO|nr:hypothetical protein [Denitromonas halophila]TVO53340.1 hypothetical protein FHP91_16310 [Denitromonas halophila]